MIQLKLKDDKFRSRLGKEYYKSFASKELEDWDIKWLMYGQSIIIRNPKTIGRYII